MTERAKASASNSFCVGVLAVAALAAGVSTSCAGEASNNADGEGAVVVNGKTVIEAQQGAVTSIAIGSDVSSVVCTGSAAGATVKGDVTIVINGELQTDQASNGCVEAAQPRSAD